MFNNYPYGDLHEINLDWFLKKFRGIESKVNELEGQPDALTATSGQVVTADGNGGWSWQDPQQVTPSEKEAVRYIFPKNFANTLQGDCNIIMFGDTVIMIDAHLAGAYSNVNDMLDHYNITHIDYFILTHYHLDHFGGMSDLVNDGFIDSDTVVYLPANTAMVTSDATLDGYRTTIRTLLTNAGISYSVPAAGSYVDIGDLKMTFYNCSDNMVYANYNNQSTIVMFEYGAHRALFTGDCYSTPLADMVYNGYVNDHINLYKVGHHGINAGSDDGLSVFFNIASPDFAYVPDTLLGQEGNLFHNGQQCAILQSIGTHIYPSSYNSDYIEFNALPDTVWTVTGHSVEALSSQRTIRHVYVSKDDAGQTQYGTQTYPYATVQQAVASCDFHAAADYRIHIKPCTDGYGDEHDTVGKNTITLFDASIMFDVWDDTQVEVKCFLVAMNSDVRIKNIKFTAPDGGTEGLLIFRGCKVSIESSILDCDGHSDAGSSEDDSDTPDYMNALYLYRNCICNLDNVTFTDAHYGIASNNSQVTAVSTTFNTCDQAYTIAMGSTLKEYNTTYNSVTTQKDVRNGSYDISEMSTKLDTVYADYIAMLNLI